MMMELISHDQKVLYIMFLCVCYLTVTVARSFLPGFYINHPYKPPLTRMNPQPMSTPCTFPMSITTVEVMVTKERMDESGKKVEHANEGIIRNIDHPFAQDVLYVHNDGDAWIGYDDLIHPLLPEGEEAYSQNEIVKGWKDENGHLQHYYELVNRGNHCWCWKRVEID